MYYSSFPTRLGAMKFSVSFSVLLAALVASAAASSSQFSSSYVADLGKDFDEKVTSRHAMAASLQHENYLIA